MSSELILIEPLKLSLSLSLFLQYVLQQPPIIKMKKKYFKIINLLF